MRADRKQAWLIYALGGGFGHLNRTLALARQAVASGVSCTILHNCRYASIVTEAGLWKAENLGARIKLVAIPDVIPPEKLGQHLSPLFDPNQNFFDRLIVDTFPRGLAGELPALLNQLDSRTKRVLVARDLNPDYVEKFDVLKFATQHFEIILNPGEADQSSLSKICTHSTDPWLVRRRDELSAIRQKHLNMKEVSKESVLVICAGKTEDADIFADIAAELENMVKKFSVARLFASVHSHWPGIDRIAEADVVIGSGGYNTVNECRFSGVPLIALIQPRLYDRQMLRATNSGFCVAKTKNEVFRALEQCQRKPIPGTLEREIANGAIDAHKIICAF